MIANGKVVDHKFENGKGVITFDSPVTSFKGHENVYLSWFSTEILNDTSGDDEIPSDWYESGTVNRIYLPNCVERLAFSPFGGTAVTEITLPNSLMEFDEGTFVNSYHIETIKFKGTMQEWENIWKAGWTGLDEMQATVVHCIDGDVQIKFPEPEPEPEPEREYKDEQLEEVDLGLPSGTKWANMNVGADNPEECGLYFSYGDTVGYTRAQVSRGDKSFNTSSYWDTTNKYNTNGGLTQLELVDDAANVLLGSGWRMPTEDELTELLNECTWSGDYRIDVNGNEIWGFVVTSKYNNNSIFIPKSGYIYDSDIDGVGDYCRLWSSVSKPNNQASILYADCDEHYTVYPMDKYCGLVIRAVRS